MSLTVADVYRMPPPEARIVPITVKDVTTAREYAAMVEILPPEIRDLVKLFISRVDEVKLQTGKPIQLRLDGVHVQYPMVAEQSALDYIEAAVEGFKSNGRKGIAGTLARVAKGDNDLGRLDRVTLRVGRLLRGTAEWTRDLLTAGLSIGLCGEPGSGKTTLLRDMILMAGEIRGGGITAVDTSNEIMGEGDEPHPAFHNVWQAKVGSPENLVAVLRNVIRSHGPLGIFADEVGYEAGDVRMVTQADRFGTSVTSSVHGRTLQHVLGNDLLHDLFGIREKADGRLHIVGPPCFNAFIEVRSRNYFVLHRNLEQSVRYYIEKEGPLDVEHIVTQVA